MKLIVAVDEDGGVSKGGTIPWDCPEDQQFFRLLTIGDKVAMGMNTWSTLRRPLKGRLNMVITRNESLLWGEEANSYPEFGFFTLDAALSEADWIIGGSQIYEAALSTGTVDQIYISRIPGKYDCDNFFQVPPEFTQVAQFKLSERCTVEKFIQSKQV